MYAAVQLKPARNPKGRRIAADGRTAGRDRRRQNCLRICNDGSFLLPGQAGAAASRTDMTRRQDFIGIDIANACHKALIQQ